MAGDVCIAHAQAAATSPDEGRRRPSANLTAGDKPET